MAGIFSKLFGGEGQPHAPRANAAVSNHADVLKVCEQKLQNREFEAVVTLLAPVVSDTNASADDKAQAHIMRGNARFDLGNFDGAVADFSQAFTTARAPDQKAEALWQRAQAKIASQGGNRRVSMDDFSELLRLPGVGVEQRARAFQSRAATRHYCGDFKGAADDLTSAIGLTGLSAMRRANAYLARAEVKIELRDQAGELADYNAVLAMPDAPAEQRGRALYQRGYFQQWVTHDEKAAAADYNAALNVEGLSEGVRESVKKSISTLGIDYTEERKIVEQMKAALMAQRKG